MKKQISFILFFALLAIAPFLAQAQNFDLTWNFPDLGTDEMTSIEAHGVTIHFPPDQRDVVDLLTPVVKQFCDFRDKQAEKEVAALLGIVNEEALDRARKQVPIIIGTDGVSESFDETLAAVKADVKLLSENWKQWSGGIGEMHLWNRHRVKEFSQGQMLRFPEMRIRYDGEANPTLILPPPFFSDRIVGLDKLRLKQGAVSPMRIDVPIGGEPGMSALEVGEPLAEFLTDIVKALHQSVPKIAKEVSTFIQEKIFLAEIEAQFFNAKAKQRPEVLLRAVARQHLLAVENAGRTGDEKWQRALRLSRFELPNDRDEALAFLDELERIDILDPELEGKHRQAASRFVFMGMLLAAQETDRTKPIFHVLKDLGEPIPDGGYDQAGFLKVARRIYPKLDHHIEASRSKLLESSRVLIEQNFPEKKGSPDEAVRADRESDLPEHYKTKQFGEFTLTYPGELSEAVDRIGQKWTAELAEARKSLLQKYQKEGLVNPIEITRQDLSSLESHGFEIEPESVKLWRYQVATMMNIEQIFCKIFDGNRIAIWMKEDIKSVLAEGGHIENFSYDFDRDVANLRIGAKFKFSDFPENFTFADLGAAYAAIKPPVLGVVLKKANIDGKSVDEQIAEIRSDRQPVNKIISAGSQLTPKALLGRTEKAMSEPESFFLIVHELVEGSLIQTTIASEDRRWFCDGLANAIAIRECDRRFGKDVGRKTFESLFNPEELKPMVDQVNLFSWKAVENERENVTEAEGLTSAHYYFATEAILAALDGRDGEFIAKWIAKIRETNWQRTNAKTVISAYNKIATDADLEKIISEHSGPRKTADDQQ